MRVFSRFAATGVVVAALVAAGTVSAIAGESGPPPTPNDGARQILLRSRAFDPLTAPAEADRAPAGLRASVGAGRPAGARGQGENGQGRSGGKHGPGAAGTHRRTPEDANGNRCQIHLTPSG